MQNTEKNFREGSGAGKRQWHYLLCPSPFTTVAILAKWQNLLKIHLQLLMSWNRGKMSQKITSDFKISSRYLVSVQSLTENHLSVTLVGKSMVQKDVGQAWLKSSTFQHRVSWMLLFIWHLQRWRGAQSLMIRNVELERIPWIIKNSSLMSLAMCR